MVEVNVTVTVNILSVYLIYKARVLINETNSKYTLTYVLLNICTLNRLIQES